MSTRYARRPKVDRRTDGTRANKYPADCALCRGPVAARAGNLRRNPSTDRYEVTHRPAEWRGSPVSGEYVGGCPAEWADPDGAAEIVTTTFSTGETMTRNARGLCEDAPCCGCCS